MDGDDDWPRALLGNAAAHASTAIATIVAPFAVHIPFSRDSRHPSRPLRQPAQSDPVRLRGRRVDQFDSVHHPMIPITAAIVGGTSAAAGTSPRPNPWRPAILTFSYVLGLALVYAALGLFAGMSGTLFGSVSTNPWLYFAMANLLLIAALAMLDVLPV